MDSDGLPLVGPGIDYTKVEAINQKRIIAFLNHFISHTASFLNRFSCVCEEKLENLSNRLQQVEITMNLLEAKISSIPGLEGVTASSSAQATTSDGAATPGASGTPGAASTSGAASTPGPTSTSGQADPPAPDAPAPPPEEPQVAANPVCNDPRYARFFKMLKVRVPEHAIKGKMEQEGLDSSLLDTPDAPAPAGGSKQNDDDDDDFSDATDTDADEDDDDDSDGFD